MSELSAVQKCTVAVSTLVGLLLAGYGAAGSYQTVTRLAAREDVPLPGLVPLGIDGGLVGVIVLDLVLVWTGQPVGWLRQLVRLLTVGTVVANAAGGWPDPVAVGLHVAAPVLLLAMVEAARTVLLRRIGARRGTLRDRIPVARWVLAPWRTWLLWRRMVLWQITSYQQALDTELAVRHAITLLRAQFGRRWSRDAPADLVWMLCNGIDIDHVRARVRALVGLDDDRTQVDLPSPVRETADRDSVVRAPVRAPSVEGSHDERPTSRTDSGRIRAATEHEAGTSVSREINPGEVERAMRVNAEHWTSKGRPVSAETLREQLRIGSAKARRLTRTVRETDRSTICGTT